MAGRSLHSDMGMQTAGKQAEWIIVQEEFRKARLVIKAVDHFTFSEYFLESSLKEEKTLISSLAQDECEGLRRDINKFG